MARKKRKSLIFTIMRMSVIPIAILGVVMTFYSQNSVHEGMVFEIEKSLSGIAHNLISIYNVLDAGDFSQKDDRVYKGETEITPVRMLLYLLVMRDVLQHWLIKKEIVWLALT